MNLIDAIVTCHIDVVEGAGQIRIAEHTFNTTINLNQMEGDIQRAIYDQIDTKQKHGFLRDKTVGDILMTQTTIVTPSGRYIDIVENGELLSARDVTKKMTSPGVPALG